ncbi:MULTISPECIES: Wzt carbohydrate-binding domain-containing protein [Bradyrhizobium]|uniref:Wzt C-terminal domain-containing protein n=2 Tax=Bradyrhizobium TaxID=374 RepID=A0ABY0Q8U3_9BRAD|nr:MULTISPECIES: Wzt carbohydrate-binding domain-containing protein [Bradyrhizobium]SDJ71039.1 Wzt C-terminal domain-containing protein [Bradyrhizobium ottawaense]SEC22548.1 Wzt C-terminal domain-containing protein [Bradyrhizobium lablabi]
MTSQSPALQDLTIRSTEILDSTGKPVRGLEAGETYLIAITVTAVRAVKNISIGYNIKLANGIAVYGTSSAIQGHLLDFEGGETKVSRFTFKPDLGLGTYYLSSGVAETLTPEDEIHNYVMLDFVHDALPFVVASDKNTGLANLKSEIISFEKIGVQ